MSRIAIVTLDSFTSKIAGPAIRVWEMARVLSEAGHDVTVLTFSHAERESESFTLIPTSVPAFRDDISGYDIVIVQGFLMQTFPWLADGEHKLVVDLYDPFHLESLEVEKNKPLAERFESLRYALGELDAQVRGGDFFICANERQRDLWLGQLASVGRITPDLYDRDPTLRSLIDIAPFGIAEDNPVRTRLAAKGVIDGIAKDDKLVLWGGGIYNWFDPLTVIRAIDRARKSVPNIRLLFMGAKHPNPDVPEMKMAVQARELVRELGLGDYVFFNEDWVDYADRHNYLLDADLAVSAHLPGIETDFSFRTRMLDYLWAQRPIVCTEGDFFADLVTTETLGRVVACHDAEAMAEAFVELLGESEESQSARAEISRNLTTQVDNFRWSVALDTLVRYCKSPWETSPHTSRVEGSGGDGLPSLSLPAKVRSLSRRTIDSLRTHGIGETAQHIKRYVQTKLV
ncbi:MAG: glycosyltransferase [Actinomycetaceae bacterium]|nr:glycosyltransferase [Actinomycetaceae bacterium]